jgi:hypothetical protein
MILLKISIVIAAFIAGYFVGSNNPTKSVIKKIKDKL